MQLGFSPDAWKAKFPHHRVLQLAVDGGNPLPALRDLASDQSFHGTVICDIEAWSILARNLEGPHTEYLSYFHKQWGPSKAVECALRSALQGHFVFLNPGLSPPEIAKLILRRRWPQPQYIWMRGDRWVQADYKVADVEWQKKRWSRLNREAMPALKSASRQQWREAVDEIRGEVQQIRERGGNVVFVRFPSSGELREIEEKYFPKADFWDDFARSVGTETIHFEDVPSMREFRCPENSHLDERDAPGFTRALAEELVRRGVLHSVVAADILHSRRPGIVARRPGGSRSYERGGYAYEAVGR